MQTQDEGKHKCKTFCCPSHFCFCYSIRSGLLCSEVTLAISSGLNLVITYNSLGNVVCSSTLLAASMIALIATIYRMKRTLIWTCLLTASAFAGLMVFNVFIFLEAAVFLENSWYKTLVPKILDERSVELLFSIVLIGDSLFMMMLISLIFWHCLSLALTSQPEADIEEN